jgi:hypothetical protein
VENPQGYSDAQLQQTFVRRKIVSINGRLRDMQFSKDYVIDKIRDYHAQGIINNFTRLSAGSGRYSSIIGKNVTGSFQARNYGDYVVACTVRMNAYMKIVKIRCGTIQAAYMEALYDLVGPHGDKCGIWTSTVGFELERELRDAMWDLALPLTRELRAHLEELQREMRRNPEWSYPLLDFFQTKVIKNGRVNDNMEDDMIDVLGALNE